MVFEVTHADVLLPHRHYKFDPVIHIFNPFHLVLQPNETKKINLKIILIKQFRTLFFHLFLANSLYKVGVRGCPKFYSGFEEEELTFTIENNTSLPLVLSKDIELLHCIVHPYCGQSLTPVKLPNKREEEENSSNVDIELDVSLQ